VTSVAPTDRAFAADRKSIDPMLSTPRLFARTVTLQFAISLYLCYNVAQR
jgi:hypothetical protein